MTIAPVALVDFTFGVLPSWITFTAAGNRMQYDSTGKLTYGPNNLLTYSNTFSNAAWTNNFITAASGVSDPLGGSNAWTFTATNGAGSSYRYQTATVAPSGAQVLNTVWLRRRTGSGSVYISTPANSDTLVSLTGSWAQYYVAGAASGTTAYLVVKLATNGDAVDVYAPTLSQVTYETTPRTQDQVITTSAAYYGPRFDYDPSTLAARGLLIEESRTNLALNSAALSNWTVSNGTVTNNSGGTTDPSGLNTSTLINPTGGSTTSFYSAAITTATSTTYTVSAFVKTGGAGFAGVAFYDDTNSVLKEAVFDLSTGANTFTSAGVTALTSVNIGNGWWRVSAQWTTANNTVSVLHIVYPHSNGAGGAPAASDKVYVYGPQFELGSFATSYIPTTSASVTRAADVATLGGVALTALQGANVSVIAEATAPATPAVLGSVVGYNTGQDFLAITTANKLASDPGGALGITSPANTITIGSPFRAAMSMRTSGAISGVLNGGTVATATGTAPASLTAANLGSINTGFYLNGWFRLIAVYNQRLPDATLKAKSIVGASF